MTSLDIPSFRVGSLSDSGVTLTRILKGEELTHVSINWATLKTEKPEEEYEVDEDVEGDSVVKVVKVVKAKKSKKVKELKSPKPVKPAKPVKPVKVKMDRSGVNAGCFRRGRVTDLPRLNIWTYRWSETVNKDRQRQFGYGPLCELTKEEARAELERFRDAIYPAGCLAATPYTGRDTFKF